MAKKKPQDVEIALDKVSITQVDEASATKPQLKYEFPYWSNKEARHLIVHIVDEQGRKQLASIMDKDGTNPDMKAVLEQFTEEEIDANTKEGLDRRNENIKRQMERRETEKVRAAQEMLFAAKLDAFEIPAIKASKDIELKKLIRKSKTPMEVSAYATILLNKEMQGDELEQVKYDALNIETIKKSKKTKLKKQIKEASSITEVHVLAAALSQDS